MADKPSTPDGSAVIKIDGGVVEIYHVLRTGAPICPKCGKGLESEGGSVVPAGSWEDGPLYWRCEDDDETWGFA